MITVHFTDINWDTDGEFIEHLPTETTLTMEDDADISLEGANLLSDEYGWCVNSFNFEIVETKVVFKKITFFYDENKETITEINAIFPDELQAVVNGEKHYLGYAHIGQHCEFHEDFLIDGFVGKHKIETATEEEYKELKTELESIGYKLKIV